MSILMTYILIFFFYRKILKYYIFKNYNLGMDELNNYNIIII